jgi:hypothetical protein
MSINKLLYGAMIRFPCLRRMMFRHELPRIYELHDLVPDSAAPDFYFRNLDQSLAGIPQKLKQYRDIEVDLHELDPAAWAFLKCELAPLLTNKDVLRGWQPIFDKLNQAKAYNYLKRAAYERVEFIPPAKVKGQQTPDLQAWSGSAEALCEVKTINISEIEALRRDTGGVGTSTDRLGTGFFTKLDSDLRKAKSQMDAFDSNPAIRRIVYVIINYDDNLHEYSDRYQPQIDAFLKSHNPVPEIEVRLDIKPPFYGARG